MAVYANICGRGQAWECVCMCAAALSKGGVRLSGGLGSQSEGGVFIRIQMYLEIRHLQSSAAAGLVSALQTCPQVGAKMRLCGCQGATVK